MKAPSNQANSAPPLVSIIIPAYNVADYLNECVGSVLKQTLQNFEIIIINDGSTDKTGEIMRELVKNDTRIRLIEQENQGQGSARNSGIRQTRGEAIAFLDADDYYAPDILESAVTELLKENGDILIFNGHAFADNGITEARDYDPKPYFPLALRDAGQVMNGLAFLRRTGGRIQQPGMKLFRRDFLVNKALFFPEGGYGEDTWFFYATMIAADRVVYLNKSGYYRRYRQSSTMTGTGISNIQNRLHSFIPLTGLLDRLEAPKDERMVRKQFSYYACLLWVMVLTRADRRQKAQLMTALDESQIITWIQHNKSNPIIFIFSMMMNLPQGLDFIKTGFAQLIRMLLKNKTHFLI